MTISLCEGRLHQEAGMARYGLTAALWSMAILLLSTSCGPVSQVDPWESAVIVDLRPPPFTKVDVLFVIDTSSSMQEEQAVISGQIEGMVRELFKAPNAPEDLHVGVITTDLGSDGFEVHNCDSSEQGDSGVLQNTGGHEGCLENYRSLDCTSDGCPWLSHSSENPDDGSDPTSPPIWADVDCISSLGSSGCDFSQPLEASLVALARNTVPGGPNEGFLRDDSLLTLIYITDADDCSASDTTFFDPDREDLGSLKLRCDLNEELLHGVSRYHEALSGLRPGRPDLVSVAVIAGIPTDGTWIPGQPIDELRELRRVNPEAPDELLPICTTHSAQATAPVRLVELSYLFGGCATLESICSDNWSSALVNAAQPYCTGRIDPCPTPSPFPSDAPRECRILEHLHDDSPCPHLADRVGADRNSGWHVDHGLDDEGRRRCEILTADYNGDGCPDPAPGRESCSCEAPFDGCLAGWFFTTEDELCEAGQNRFTSSDVTSDLSRVLAYCP